LRRRQITGIAWDPAEVPVWEPVSLPCDWGI
jgi:hypothetical protein